MDDNNLFQYATKELSQDAFFCWLINWIKFPEKPQYRAGIETLNLFLGKNRKEQYFHVEVKRQYKKIDVLILFNDKYALIIEDKTNTSEHGNQIERYKKILESDYPERTIFTVYVKTGIIYDEDARIVKKADSVVTLEDLLNTLLPFRGHTGSDILDDYIEYIASIAGERRAIDAQISSGAYSAALETYYGQFSFLNQLFPNRSKGMEVGKAYIDKAYNPPIYRDYIYAGTNNGGTPWIQYCFWAQKYPEQLKQDNSIEYHYLFWRLDCNWIRENKDDPNCEYIPEFYIALRHYDENAKMSDAARQRKKDAYRMFRKICEPIENAHPEIFRKIGIRENYKESDLLFIPLSQIRTFPFNELKNLLNDITQKVMIS